MLQPSGCRIVDWRWQRTSKKCPLLAIHGENDEYGSTRHPQLIAEHASAARIEVLAQIGHMPQREQPQTVLKLIAQWLDEARP